jgi:hypothetical protein
VALLDWNGAIMRSGSGPDVSKELCARPTSALREDVGGASLKGAGPGGLSSTFILGISFWAWQ